MMSTLPLFATREKPDTRKLTELARSMSPGMRPVTQAQFFAYIGPRDISPVVYGTSTDESGMYSIFKTRQGDAVGKHFGGNYRSDSIFLLRSDLIK
jgi:hypothetical protein